MSPSELWMVNHYAVSPEMPGGTRHYDLATELAGRGIGVKIFASDVNLALRKHMKLSPGERYRIERVGDVDFVWIDAALYSGNNWRRGWNMLTFSLNVLRVAPRVAADKKPTAILGSSPHPFAALAAHRLSRRYGVPFILELRDLWPQAIIDIGGLSERHPAVIVMRALESHLYRHASRIVVLAEGSRDYLVRRGVADEKIVFLPNGVHLGHFVAASDRDAARRRHGFTRFTAIYTGAHGPANSLDTLIRAAKMVEDEIDVVLVGDGPAKASLQALSADLGCRNVRFLEPVPKAEVPDLLQAADAAVITLRNAKAFEYGISPNKLFDYMAARRPVVCSVGGDMARLVETARAGFPVPPENPDRLAAALRTIRGMTTEERSALGDAGRRFLAENFMREVLVDRLEAVVRSFSARAPSGG